MKLTPNSYDLIDRHLHRLAPGAPCGLADVHQADDPMLVAMYELALIGAEAVEAGPSVQLSVEPDGTPVTCPRCLEALAVQS